MVDSARPPNVGDRRVHTRVPCIAPVDTDDGAALGFVLDVSEGGALLRTSRPLTTGERLNLSIGAPSGRIRASATVLGERTVGWGVQFEPLSADAATAVRALVDPGPAAAPRAAPELISAPDRVASLVRALLGRNRTARLGEDRAEVALLPPQSAERPLRWVAAEPPVGPVRVELEGFNARYVMEVTEFSFADGAVSATPPASLQRLRQRSFARATPNQQLSVRLPDLSADAEGDVVDLSATGLAVHLPHLELDEGRWLNLALEADGQVTEIAAVVRYAESDRYGLEVADPNEARWLDLVARAVHPSTQVSAGVDPAGLWDLYRDSGYFAISDHTPESFADQWEAFRLTFQRLEAAPAIGEHILWLNEGHVDAALSMLRIYKDTWLPFQFAKRQGAQRGGTARRTILSDLHLRGIELMLRNRCQWMCTTFRRDPTLARTAQELFVAQVGDPTLADVVPQPTWQLDSEQHVRPRPGLSLRQGGSVDAVELLSTAQVPVAYAESQDLVEARFWLPSIRWRWSEHGLTRGRELWVAERAGAPVAWAVVEWASEGMHVFRLLDSVRVFYAGPPDPDAGNALLDTARTRFHALGKPSFSFFEVPEHPLVPERARELGMADVFCVHRDVLPEFAEHVMERVGSR
jgi:PilZ domain